MIRPLRCVGGPHRRVAAGVDGRRGVRAPLLGAAPAADEGAEGDPDDEREPVGLGTSAHKKGPFS
jgi:hypothetical protein